MDNNVVQSQTSEDEKVSYWLEKLHKQGEEKISRLPSETQSERTFEEKGQDDYIEHQATKKEEDSQVVSDLMAKSNRSIISITSLFPLDLFPSTINVEESRVTFIFRQFLASQSHSIEIKDIANVFIESSLFLATIQVVSRTFVQNDIKIGNLYKKKAVEVQRIIEGLRTFREYNINTSDYGVDELIAKIKEFHTN